jgi:hypothetical protein
LIPVWKTDSHHLEKFATSLRISAPQIDTHPWRTYWDENTERKPGIPSTQHDVTENYGVPHQSIEDLLKHIDVLQRNESEYAIQNELFEIRHDKNEFATAFIAAADLLKELRYNRPEGSTMSGAYIANNQHRCDVPVVFDTGCSFSITPFKEDFTSTIEKTDVKDLAGLTDTVAIAGVGWIEWPIRDVFGQIAVLRTQAYYVPTASIRLHSPQCYFIENQAGHCYFDCRKLIFAMADGQELTFPFSYQSNIPLMYLDKQGDLSDWTDKQSE